MCDAKGALGLRVKKLLVAVRPDAVLEEVAPRGRPFKRERKAVLLKNGP